MSGRIRKRMSGDRRRGSLKNLVRTRTAKKGQGLRYVLFPASVYRYLSVVGPQAPVGFEDSSWVASPGWKVYFNYSAAPTYISWQSPHNHWVRRMAPMRFRIDSLLDSFSGFGYPNIRDQFESNVNNIGHSSVTPPAESHLRGLEITSASFPLRGIWFNAYNSNVNWSTSLHVSHYRILVDGIDQTGVVAFSSPLSLNTNTNMGVPRIFSGVPTALLPVQAGPSQTVEIDFWVYIDTGGGPFETQGPGSDWPLCNIHYQSAFARAELRGQARQVQGTYMLTFSAGGPQPSIVLTEQPGWTYSSTPSAQTLANNEWSITLDWSREYAQLILIHASQHNVPSGAGSRMKYYPAASGDYDGVEFRSGLVAKPGVWNSKGTTVFSLRQRQTLSNINATENGDLLPRSFFSAFPTAITVERV